MCDVSFIIRYIKPQKAMRIGYNPLRDDARHGHFLRGVVCGVAVVRPERGRSRQENERRNNEYKPFHAKPSFLQDMQTLSPVIARCSPNDARAMQALISLRFLERAVNFLSCPESAHTETGFSSWFVR